jgi:long-chain acyl-CoA synthetase
LGQSGENFIEYYEGGKKWKRSFAEVHLDVLAATRFFGSKGLSRGDRVGFIGHTCYKWVVLDLACVVKGLVTVPFDMNQYSTTSGLVEAFQLSLLLVNMPHSERSCGAVNFFDEIEVSPKTIGPSSDIVPERYDDDEVFTTIFSSATSGAPKAVEVRVKCFDDLIANTQRMFQFRSDDKILIFLPLSVYLERCYIYGAILVGFNVVLTPIEFAFRAIAVDAPAIIIGVPVFFEGVHQAFTERIRARRSHLLIFNVYLLARRVGLGFLFRDGFGPFKRALGGRVRYLLTGSAPCSLRVLRFFNDMGIPLYEGYGITEIAGMVSLNAPGAMRIGSVGRPFPNKQISLDHESQIIVKGEFLANTHYRNATPEENAKTYLPDGSVATGDVGHIDHDGFLYITGRLKDVIILSNGKKVHPATVEARFEASSLIRNCVVYGDGRPYIVALLVPARSGISNDMIEREMKRINRYLPIDYQVHRFFIVHEKFAPDNNMLTPALKLNRKYVVSRYDKRFSELY